MTTVLKKTTLVLVTLILGASVSAQAQVRRGRFVEFPRRYVYAPYAYDPFWGPYYSYYPYYSYRAYPYAVAPTADVRVQVVPKQAEVYVDGYYAGTADDFDGVFKHLHTTPGGHALTLHLDGYRTVTQSIYVSPDATVKVQESMEKLPAGEVSAPPPLPARSPRFADRPSQG